MIASQFWSIQRGQNAAMGWVLVYYLFTVNHSELTEGNLIKKRSLFYSPFWSFQAINLAPVSVRSPWWVS